MFEGSGTGGGAPAWGSCVVNVGDAKGIAQLSCIPELFKNILYAAILFGGTVALVMLIYGGLRLMLSGGEAKQAGAARQTITYAIIGLLVVLFSIAILNVISYLTGVTCIKTFDFANCQ